MGQATGQTIVDRERTTYEDIFDAVPTYSVHSPGEMYAPLFMDMAGLKSGQGKVDRLTVLDAGCGTGKGALALDKAGFNVRMCDLTPHGIVPEAQRFRFDEAILWDPLLPQLGHLGFGGKVDYVYCCDVMEHIPKELTMLAAVRLLEAARIAAFFSISLAQDTYGVWLGKSLHQTIEKFTWWRDNLNTIGRVVEARDLLNCGLFLVAPVNGRDDA